MTDSAKAPQAKVSLKTKLISLFAASILFFSGTVFLFSNCTSSPEHIGSDCKIIPRQVVGEALPIHMITTLLDPYVPPLVYGNNELIICSDQYLQKVEKRIKLPGEYVGFDYNYINKSGDPNNAVSANFDYYYFIISQSSDSKYISVLKCFDDEKQSNIFLGMEKVKEFSIGESDLVAILTDQLKEDFTFVCQDKKQTGVSFYNNNGTLTKTIHFGRKIVLSPYDFKIKQKVANCYGFDGKYILIYSIEHYSLIELDRILLRNSYSETIEVFNNNRMVGATDKWYLSAYDGNTLYLVDPLERKVQTYNASKFIDQFPDSELFYFDNKLSFSRFIHEKNKTNPEKYDTYIIDGIIDQIENANLICCIGGTTISTYCVGYWSEKGYMFINYNIVYSYSGYEVYKKEYGPFKDVITTFFIDDYSIGLYSNKNIYEFKIDQVKVPPYRVLDVKLLEQK